MIASPEKIILQMFNDFVFACELIASKWHAYNALLFGYPCNSQILSIIILYEEILIIGVVIMYIIIESMATIIDEYKFTNNPYPFHFSPEMEAFLDVFFLLFPSSVILYILMPTLGFLYNGDLLNEASHIAFSVSIIGHQWYWSYIYHVDIAPLMFLENEIVPEYVFKIESSPIYSFEFDSILEEDAIARLLNTDCKVIFPSFTVIRLDITSEDVIHSWSLPQLGIKVDAIPGRVATVLLFCEVEGIFYGQCSELCGPYHAFMPIEVHFVSGPNFFVWLLCECEVFLEYLDTIENTVDVDSYKKIIEYGYLDLDDEEC